MTRKILHVVGARPNFMKAAPVIEALTSYDFSQILVHTGQHYDANMSEIFFDQLQMPKPDINLGIGGGSHAVQTAQIMMQLEEILNGQNPDMVLVYGDVNSTVAAALVCAKLLIPFGHVEAGLRSNDRRMPEEINRLVTDQLADYLFTPSRDGDQNLLQEGVAEEKIHCIGNVMIDTLVRLQSQATRDFPLSEIAKKTSIPQDSLDNRYALVTLHRPSNVDEPAMLRKIISTLQELSRSVTIIFPLHPRTRKKLLAAGNSLERYPNLFFTEPLGYLEFLTLQINAALVITDSGGIQEETTFTGVPCLTVRENTERPITVTIGSNILVGQDMTRLKDETFRILAGAAKESAIPHLWDGKASERLAAWIDNLYQGTGKTVPFLPATTPRSENFTGKLPAESV
jgi:UDP-N-acetylglucosamine 2-epimerase (non-hydrolysing)